MHAHLEVAFHVEDLDEPGASLNRDVVGAARLGDGLDEDFLCGSAVDLLAGDHVTVHDDSFLRLWSCSTSVASPGPGCNPSSKISRRKFPDSNASAPTPN